MLQKDQKEVCQIISYECGNEFSVCQVSAGLRCALCHKIISARRFCSPRRVRQAPRTFLSLSFTTLMAHARTRDSLYRCVYADGWSTKSELNPPSLHRAPLLERHSNYAPPLMRESPRENMLRVHNSPASTFN